MHALAARAVRERIPVDALPAVTRAAADALQRLWPQHNHENRELVALLRANVVHLDQYTRPALWQPTTHPCIYTVSKSLTGFGLYHQAIEYDETTVHLSTSIHGPDHPDTVSARSNFPISYSDIGRLEEALNLGERVLADRERLLDPDHPDTLTARNNLARTRDAAAAVQQPGPATPATSSDHQRRSGAPEQPV